MTKSSALCASLTLGLGLSLGACKGDTNGEAKDGAKPAEEDGEKPADGDKPAEAPTPAVGADEEAKPEAPAGERPTEDAGVAGSYTSGAMTLAISNVTKEGFDFRLSSPSAADGDDDPCAGIDYKGGGTFDTSDPTKATTEHEGTLAFAEGSVHYEPSMEMIGNECARQIDVEFKRASK